MYFPQPENTCIAYPVTIICADYQHLYVCLPHRPHNVVYMWVMIQLESDLCDYVCVEPFSVFLPWLYIFLDQRCVKHFDQVEYGIHDRLHIYPPPPCGMEYGIFLHYIIYTIILLKSVSVRKLQVTILARSSWVMSLTVRIV